MRSLPVLILTIVALTVQVNSEKISMQQALALGVVQGLTEFLPVSSTGHMILVNECCFKTVEPSEQAKNALNNYVVCIQLGTILTLLWFYRKDILEQREYLRFGQPIGNQIYRF